MDIRLDKLADFNETQFAKEANFVPGYYTNSDRITKDLTKNKIYMQVKYNCPRN